jgi:preprotein translocase subunit SecG
MIILLTILHVIVCFFLVIVVLLQSGKAADLAGAFGGMGSQTAFGPRGSATVLSKATTIAAGIFMVTSLSLSVAATRGSGGAKGGSTILEKHLPAGPAAPATKAPSPQAPALPGGISIQTSGGAAEIATPRQPAPAAGQQAPAAGQPAPGRPAPAPAPARK